MKRAPIKALPSAERLHELLAYDPQTGFLTWRVHRKKNRTIVPGTRAGSTKGIDHRILHIDGTNYLAHRIIWKMMTGNDPVAVIDHRDLDKDNNAWANLREATHSQNKANGRMPKSNTTGFKGVSKRKGYNRWRVIVAFNGKFHRVGDFSTPEEAAEARAKAAALVHGDFARTA